MRIELKVSQLLTSHCFHCPAYCGDMCFIMLGRLKLKTDSTSLEEYRRIRCAVSHIVYLVFTEGSLSNIPGALSTELLYSGAEEQECLELSEDSWTSGGSNTLPSEIEAHSEDKDKSLSASTQASLASGALIAAVLVGLHFKRRRVALRDNASDVDPYSTVGAGSNLEIDSSMS
jgi:hypothetical protein